MNNLKTFSLRSVLLLGSLGALTLSAHAQTAIARAKVPFEFAAAGAMMPAGEYTIDASDVSGVLVLHGSAGNSVAMITTFSDTTPPTASVRLVFERRNGMAYLTAVEWPDQSAQVVSMFKRVTKATTASLR